MVRYILAFKLYLEFFFGNWTILQYLDYFYNIQTFWATYGKGVDNILTILMQYSQKSNRIYKVVSYIVFWIIYELYLGKIFMSHLDNILAKFMQCVYNTQNLYGQYLANIHMLVVYYIEIKTNIVELG